MLKHFYRHWFQFQSDDNANLLNYLVYQSEYIKKLWLNFNLFCVIFQKQNKVSLLKRDPHAENEWVFLEC